MRALSVAFLALAGCPGDFDPDLVGFQPDHGIYSACSEAADCDGDPCLGVDVLSTETTEPREGACTRWVEGTDPTDECGPYPDGYATAILAYGMTDGGDLFCVLECAGGLKCPVGMACVRVRSSTTVYESEVCL